MSKKDKMDVGKVYGCIDFRKMVNVFVFLMKGMGDMMFFIGVYFDVFCKFLFKLNLELFLFWNNIVEWILYGLKFKDKEINGKDFWMVIL